MTFLEYVQSIKQVKEGTVRNNWPEIYQEIIDFIGNQNITVFSEKTYRYLNNMIFKSECKKCGNLTRFLNFKSGYGLFCSRKCATSYNANLESVKQKTLKTNLEKYGVTNVFKSKEVRDKIKQNNLLKYGFEYPIQSEEIKNKIKETNLERYGVEHTFQSENNKNKSIQTSLEKYGTLYPNQSEEVKSKIRKKVFENYGVDNVFKSEEIRKKIKNTNVERYGVEYPAQNLEVSKKSSITKTQKWLDNITEEIISYDKESKILALKCNHDHEFNINSQLYYLRNKNNQTVCTVCNPLIKFYSHAEKEVVKYIRSVYSGTILENYKFNGIELDILLPELNLAIEYNGLYRHCEIFKDKYYHLDKTKICQNFDIQLIHIWEDLWLFKQVQVQNYINSLVLIEKVKIFARKCIVKELSNNQYLDFLENNHFQGKISSKVKIGLFYNNELVSVMGFGKIRYSKNEKSDDNYELLRYCSKYKVIGGAQKIFSYFIKKYNPNLIKSYSDNSMFLGNVYSKLNMNLEYTTDVGYTYHKDNVRMNRHHFQKHKLKEDTKIPARIWDCGQNVWYWRKNN